MCEWDLDTIEMALIPACIVFFDAIGSILSGKLADKYGRWPVMAIASYLICVSGLVSALANSYILFVISRSFTG